MTRPSLVFADGDRPERSSIQIIGFPAYCFHIFWGSVNRSFSATISPAICQSNLAKLFGGEVFRKRFNRVFW